MHVLTSVSCCSVVVVAAGWTRGAAVAPPRSSGASTSKVDSSSAQHHLLEVSLPPVLTKQQPWPALTQFCGPITVNLRVHGRSFRIRSGYCASYVFWQYELYAGLAGYVPTPQDKFFGLAVHDPRAVQGGTFTRVYGAMQLAGHSLRSIGKLDPPAPRAVGVPEAITRGTVTIAKSLLAGTFVFHLRDATAITGSWTCGEKPYHY
jgi:hypothetical protein